eukprot:2928294-Pyramimonas_sp.AAC.1
MKFGIPWAIEGYRTIRTPRTTRTIRDGRSIVCDRVLFAFFRTSSSSWLHGWKTSRNTPHT